MSLDNPHFKNRERAPCELAYLLRELPRHVDLRNAQNEPETRLQLEAAERHADNYRGVLLDGLVSMGRVMFCAASNEDWPVQQHDVSRIGALIAEMGVQLQFLNEFCDMAVVRLHEADQKGARK